MRPAAKQTIRHDLSHRVLDATDRAALAALGRLLVALAEQP